MSVSHIACGYREDTGKKSYIDGSIIYDNSKTTEANKNLSCDKYKYKWGLKKHKKYCVNCKHSFLSGGMEY